MRHALDFRLFYHALSWSVVFFLISSTKAPGFVGPQKAVPARPLLSPDSIRGFLAGMLPPSRSAKRVTRPSQLMPVMASPKSSETSAMTWGSLKWVTWLDARATVQAPWGLDGLGTCQDQRKGHVETETKTWGMVGFARPKMRTDHHQKQISCEHVLRFENTSIKKQAKSCQASEYLSVQLGSWLRGLRTS